MNFSLNEDKKLMAIKFISLNSKNWSYIFELFKNEIFEMIELKIPKTIIVKFLSEELNTEIKYTTFVSWLKKTKSNNLSNLRKNSQKEEVKEVKKEQLKVQKQDTSISSINFTSTKEDDKPWWKKRVEELSKGMKEAAIKR